MFVVHIDIFLYLLRHETDLHLVLGSWIEGVVALSFFRAGKGTGTPTR
jgi:hypothetical protein